MSLNLRTVFSGAFAVIIILLTAILSYAIGKESTKSVEVSIGSSLAEVSYQMSEKLDYFMWSRAGEVEVLSKLNAFQEPLDKAEINRLLQQLKRSLPVFTWVGYVDVQGNVIASTDHILLGNNISQRPVFQEGMKGLFVGDVHDAVLLAKLLPNPTGEALQFVDVSVPISRQNGQKTGVLAAHLSWEWAKQVEESILAPIQEHMPGVEVFIVSNKNNTILLGPRGTTGQAMTVKALSYAQGSNYGWNVEEDASTGKSYLTGYAYGDGHLNYSGLGWSVMIRQPAEIAFASVHQLKRFILLAGLAAAVCFGILGWFLASWITRPLHNIATTADQLCSGSDVEIPSFTRFKDVSILSESLRNLVSNLTKTEDQLCYMSDMAYHDSLTGLPNRAALDDFLGQALHRTRQNGNTLSILYLDLDGFKQVNDSYGHAAGDKLLQAVSRRILDSTREDEMVARIGGDEFVVVLNTSCARSMHEAEAVAKRIIGAINEPLMVDGETLVVGCSIGVAVYRSGGPGIKEVLHLADEALYISKRSGRNRITFETT